MLHDGFDKRPLGALPFPRGEELRCADGSWVPRPTREEKPSGGKTMGGDDSVIPRFDEAGGDNEKKVDIAG